MCCVDLAADVFAGFLHSEVGSSVRPGYWNVGGSLRGRVLKGCERGKRVVM